MSEANDTGIEWADPPMDRRLESHWDLIAAELRAHPNNWAIIRRGMKNPTAAMSIKRGRLVSFRPAGAFEARTVTVASGFDIYARYVGDAK